MDEELRKIKSKYMTAIKNTLDLECYKAALLDIRSFCNERRYSETDCLKHIKDVINMISEVLDSD